MLKKEKNYVKRYIIYTYLLFWTMVSLMAVIILQIGQQTWMFEWGSAVCSWSPTIVLLILFKKLYPNITVKEFFKKAFSPKINIPILLIVTVIQTLIIVLSAFILALRNDISFFSLWNISISTILTSLLYTTIQGATGEESGWRGFLQPTLEKKYGLIKGSLYVGVVWSFWHTPLWFATGLTGMNLLIYILTFIIGNISIALIIGTCYHKCKNLFVPIWIHFIFNFTSRFYIGEPIEIRFYLVSLYILTALGFVLWYKASFSKTNNQRNTSKLVS